MRRSERHDETLAKSHEACWLVENNAGLRRIKSIHYSIKLLSFYDRRSEIDIKGQHTRPRDRIEGSHP